jgi:cell fate (sporulation/competence/biofilm development) regulator YmcA (YheA/YmcA/DUF963 family)
MAGQPTKYKIEYNEQVEKLCKLGATDKEIGDFFNVTETTINNWKIKEPEFFESIKRGKIEADMNVADSLYKRAMGYEHDEVHITSFQGEITKTPIVKHYAPDTTAIMAWLNNRRPEQYRSKQYVESSNTNVNINEDVTELTSEERKQRIKELMEKNKK